MTKVIDLLPAGPYAEPGPPFGEVPDGYLDLHGYCSDFCNADGPLDGQTVEEHGPWCQSYLVGGVPVRDADDVPWQMFASVVRRYTHGRYTAEVIRSGARDDLIEIAAAAPVGNPAYSPSAEAFRYLIAPADARAAAAVLVRLADLADGLDRDFRERRIDRTEASR